MLREEEEPGVGDKWIFAENANKLSEVRVVDDPNSAALKMIDWIPMGLI